jgi:tetratricopeptide (TPR) repeat protein
MVRIFIFSLYLSAHSLLAQNSLFEQAQNEYREGKYREALEHTEEYLQKRKTAEALYLKAGILQSTGRDIDAARVLTDLINTWPEHQEAYLSRAYIYYQKEFNQLAIADLNHLIESPDSDTRAIFYRVDPAGGSQMQITSLASMKSSLFKTRGELYQRTGQFEKAMLDFNKALLLEESVENYVSRGLLFQEQGQKNQAIGDFKSALKIDEKSPLAWYNLALLQENTTVPKDVLKDYDFAPFASYEGAEALQSEKYEKAVRLFNLALEKNPDDLFAMENKGRTYYAMESFEEALTVFRKTYQQDPDNFRLLYLIGNTYARLREHEAAVAYYQQYLTHDPSDGSIWYNMAVSHRNLKQHADACRCLRNAEKNGFDVDDGSALWESCEIN